MFTLINLIFGEELGLFHYGFWHSLCVSVCKHNVWVKYATTQ